MDPSTNEQSGQKRNSNEIQKDQTQNSSENQSAQTTTFNLVTEENSIHVFYQKSDKGIQVGDNGSISSNTAFLNKSLVIQNNNQLLQSGQSFDHGQNFQELDGESESSSAQALKYQQIASDLEAENKKIIAEKEKLHAKDAETISKLLAENAKLLERLQKAEKQQGQNERIQSSDNK